MLENLGELAGGPEGPRNLKVAPQHACTFDRAEGEVCAEQDLNPWFIAVPEAEAGELDEAATTVRSGILVMEDIVTFARTRRGFASEDNQIPLLESDAKRALVNCSRQWGKSTLTAIKALYRLLTRPGCLVLVAGPTERQSGEFVQKIEELARLGFPDWRLPWDGFNKPSIRFPNGSRVIGLPGWEKNIRSFSAVSMIVIDESASVDDDLYRALRPMLAVGNGDMWVLGTPRGKEGFFYEEWEFGGDQWTRFQVTAAECAPRISAQFLADEVSSMGAAYVQREYFGKFLDDGGVVFDRTLVEGAVTEDWGTFDFQSSSARGDYYLGLDLGKFRDYTALALVERVRATGDLVVRYVERAALGTPYTQVVKRVEELTRHGALAGQCYLTVDATGVGQPVVESLRAAGLGCRGMTALTITAGEKARQQSTVYGGVSGECWTVPRRDLLTGVQLLLERGELKIAKGMKEGGALVRELVRMRTGKGGGGSAEHDDLALALALACWQAGRAEKPGIFGMQRLL